MSLHELIYAVVTGLALVAGFVIEWRRGGNLDGRLVAIEHRLAALEDVLCYEDRIAAIEASLDRIRRNV